MNVKARVPQGAVEAVEILVPELVLVVARLIVQMDAQPHAQMNALDVKHNALDVEMFALDHVARDVVILQPHVQVALHHAMLIAETFVIVIAEIVCALLAVALHVFPGVTTNAIQAVAAHAQGVVEPHAQQRAPIIVKMDVRPHVRLLAVLHALMGRLVMRRMRLGIIIKNRWCR